MRRDDGTMLALAVAGVTAGVALVAQRRRRPPPMGSANVDAYLDLEHPAHQAGNLEDYYPETARGELGPESHGDRVFWAGRGYQRIGYVGPTDGRMLPIPSRYASPISGNTFDGAKMGALVRAIKEGADPVVHPGYAMLGLVTKTDVDEGVEYGDPRPYTSDDIGEVNADVRDGNHRTFAALLAGAPFTWVLISDATVQDLFNPDGPRKSYFDRLYTEIRRLQRDAGATLLTRPRRKRVRRTAELDRVEKQHAEAKAQIFRLRQQLVQEFDDMGDGLSWTMEDRLERPQTFLRARLSRARDEGDEALIDRYHDSADRKELSALNKRQRDLWSRLWDLQVATGIDPRTGKAARR
jgi:hypothetical protein